MISAHSSCVCGRFMYADETFVLYIRGFDDAIYPTFYIVRGDDTVEMLARFDCPKLHVIRGYFKHSEIDFLKQLNSYLRSKHPKRDITIGDYLCMTWEMNNGTCDIDDRKIDYDFFPVYYRIER